MRAFGNEGVQRWIRLCASGCSQPVRQATRSVGCRLNPPPQVRRLARSRGWVEEEVAREFKEVVDCAVEKYKARVPAKTKPRPSDNKASWEIKKNMTGVMSGILYDQYNELKKLPLNWIRLLGAGSGGYFLIST